MIDYIGEIKRIMNMNAGETFDPATDSLEAIAAALGVGPSAGLWMFGIVDATQVASTITVITNNLQNIPNDLLEGQFYMQVIYNASAVGTAPEGENRQITNFVQGGALQTFTVDAFTANVEAGDMVCIFHQSLLSMEILARGTLDTSSTTVPEDSTRTEVADYFKGQVLMTTEGAVRFQPRPIRTSSAAGVFTLEEPFTGLPGLVDYVILRGNVPIQRLIDIFTIVNAILTTTETGGTLTTDGTEQTVYTVAAPAGVFEAKVMLINMTNLALGDTVIVRTFYRIVPGGALVPSEEATFVGPLDPAHRLIEIPLLANRYGYEVTLHQTVGAPVVDYDWEVVQRV